LKERPEAGAHEQTTPTKSFRWVAMRIGTSATRIIETVRLLEAHTGTSLINREERRSRSNLITPRGLIFYRNARNLLEDHSALKALPTSQRVIVGTTTSILTYLLPAALGSFGRRQGQGKQGTDEQRTIDLDFREFTDPRTMVAEVQWGEIDFGIARTLPEDERRSLGIEFQDLDFALGLALALPPGHRLESKADFQLADLAAEQLMTLPASYFARFVGEGQIERLPEPDERRGGRVIRMTTTEAVLRFVQAGFGVGVVTNWEAELRRLEAAGTIRVRPLPQLGQLRLAAYLPIDAARQLSPAARQVLTSINEELKKLGVVSAKPLRPRSGSGGRGRGRDR
jgi:DNA-binding transcriptional LysR family regulator